MSALPDPQLSPFTSAALTAVDNPGRVPSPGFRRRAGWSSPLQLIADRFDLLDREGDCRVDGTEIAGLPDRLLTLSETRSRLLHPASSYATRDAAFTWLLARIRDTQSDGSGDWRVVLAGVLLPGLRAVLKPMCRHQPELAAELETEALTGLWSAAEFIRLDSRRIASRLTWAAHRSAGTYLRAEQAQHQALQQAATDPAHRLGPQGHQRRSGHPDFVLAAGVAAGVLSATDADLIGRTRLEGEELCDAAARLGVSHHVVKKRRIRAETRLVAWIRHQQANSST
jgi:hypothetical protein